MKQLCKFSLKYNSTFRSNSAEESLSAYSCPSCPLHAFAIMMKIMMVVVLMVLVGTKVMLKIILISVLALPWLHHHHRWLHHCSCYLDNHLLREHRLGALFSNGGTFHFAASACFENAFITETLCTFVLRDEYNQLQVCRQPDTWWVGR